MGRMSLRVRRMLDQIDDRDRWVNDHLIRVRNYDGSYDEVGVVIFALDCGLRQRYRWETGNRLDNQTFVGTGPEYYVQSCDAGEVLRQLRGCRYFDRKSRERGEDCDMLPDLISDLEVAYAREEEIIREAAEREAAAAAAKDTRRRAANGGTDQQPVGEW